MPRPIASYENQGAASGAPTKTMTYLDLYNSGELLQRVKSAYARLESCDLCPHDCGVNRLKGKTGICRSGFMPGISSAPGYVDINRQAVLEMF